MGRSFCLYCPDKHIALDLTGLSTESPESEFMSRVFDGFLFFTFEQRFMDGRSPEEQVTRSYVSTLRAISHFLVYCPPSPTFLVPESTIDVLSAEFEKRGTEPIRVVFELEEIAEWLVVDPLPDGYAEHEPACDLLRKYLGWQ